MDCVPLADVVSLGRLQEQEAWAVVCRGLEAMEQRLRGLEVEEHRLRGLEDRWRMAVVTQRTLILTSHGEVRFDHSKDDLQLTEALPQRMKALYDLTAEDLERVAVFSLAKTVLASVSSVKSDHLLLFLRSSLSPSLSSLPLLSSVKQLAARAITAMSSRRIVTSLYYKYLGLRSCSLKKSSTVRSLPTLTSRSSYSHHLSSSTPPSSSSSTSSISSTSSSTSSVFSSSSISSPFNASQSTEADLRLRCGLKEHHYEDIDSLDSQSVDSICSFINNNDIFSLLELPGLKYNRPKKPEVKEEMVTRREKEEESSPPPALPPRRSQERARTVNVILLSGQRLRVSVKTRETLVCDLLAKSLASCKVTGADRQLFCLSVKKGGEYFYLAPSEKAADLTSSLHLRFLHYPRQLEKLSPGLKQLLHHQLSHDLAEGALQLSGQLEGVAKLLTQAMGTPTYGAWQYRGRADRRGDSHPVVLRVGEEGVELEGRQVVWRDLQQVSYSHTFLQLLCHEGPRLRRIKVCLPHPRLVYDLIKAKKERAITRVKAEGQRTRQRDLFKLDNFCEQLVKLTKDVVKTMGTPKRKRSKSADPAICKSLKKQKLTRSVTMSDTKKLSSVPPYKYKLYLEPEEDEQYLTSDKIKTASARTTPRKTRIRTTTNPLAAVDLNRAAAITKTTTPHRPRMGTSSRTPTRMGTRVQTTAIRRHQEVSLTNEADQEICLTNRGQQEISLTARVQHERWCGNSHQSVSTEPTNHHSQSSTSRSCKEHSLPPQHLSLPPQHLSLAPRSYADSGGGTTASVCGLGGAKEQVPQPPRRIVCLCLGREELVEARLRLERSSLGLEVCHASGGKLLPGDRLVAINGKSMEGAGPEGAALLLQNSGNILNFIVSRAS